MIRETLAATSRHVGVFMSATQGLIQISRPTAGGGTATSTVFASAAPYWLKLVRSGNVFTSYRSTNGVSWTVVSTATISMATKVYIGLAVTSKSTTTLNKSTFDNVSVIPG